MRLYHQVHCLIDFTNMSLNLCSGDNDLANPSGLQYILQHGNSIHVLQVNGGQLPSHVLPFCIASAGLAAMLPLASFFIHTTSKDADAVSSSPARAWMSSVACPGLLRVLPSGIGFAVGMYVAPKWTIPRVIGSLVEQGWLWWRPGSHGSLMVVVASGLVLGEGTTSIVTAVSKAVGATVG